MRSWKFAVVLLSVVLGCGEDADTDSDGSLTKSEACNMATAWVKSNRIMLQSGSESSNAVVTDCGQFRTMESEGEGSIKVGILGEFYVEGDRDVIAEVDTELMCGLLEFDQGWEVTGCVHF